MSDLHRRHVVLGLGATALCSPKTAQAALPVIGYLGPETKDVFASRLAAFHEGLAGAGVVEGRDVNIVFRWAESQHGRLRAMAAELVALGVRVIVAPGGAPGALAAREATTSIPIVFEMGADPVAIGLVAALNRPGGNLTGVSSLSVEVGPKRLEFLREVVPQATTLGVLVNPTSVTAEPQVRALRAAAEPLGVTLQVVEARLVEELAPAIETVMRNQVGGLIITSDTFLGIRGAQPLAELTRGRDLPAIHQSRDFTLAGGLLSYGGSFRESHRQCGVYAGRIIKGSDPAEMAVQQVTKLELCINLQAAKALGRRFPASLLALADETIE